MDTLSLIETSLCDIQMIGPANLIPKGIHKVIYKTARKSEVHYMTAIEPFRTLVHRTMIVQAKDDTKIPMRRVYLVTIGLLLDTPTARMNASERV